MDATKSKPTVTITPYSASNSTYLRQQQDGAPATQHNARSGQDESHATKCEFSTNLFRNQIRRQVNIAASGGPTARRQPARSHQTATLSSGDGLASRVSSGTSSSRWLADLSQIRGPTGSVRGHKDVVRKSLEGIKVTYHNRYANFSSSLTTSTSSSFSSSPSNSSSTLGGGSGSSGGSSSSSSGGPSMPSFSTFFAGRHHTGAANPNGTGSGNQTTSLTSFSSNKPPLRLSSMTSSSLLMTIDNELYCSEYLERLAEDEQDLCVAYTTTLGVIRRTFEDSKTLRSILDLNLVRYEERDIYLNQEYKCQLRLRSSLNGGHGTSTGAMLVPALYVDGVHIGGAKEVEAMNESGELARLLAKFKMSQAPREICHCCGNAKFIACQSCNGSRKSTIHHFKFNSIALRCIKCDNNDGLVQCPVCSARPHFEDEDQRQELCGKTMPQDGGEICVEVSQKNEQVNLETPWMGREGDKTNDASILVDMNNNVEC